MSLSTLLNKVSSLFSSTRNTLEYFMANTFWGFMIFVGFSVNHKPTTNHLTCNLMGNFMSLWWDNNLLILILMDILGILANSDRWSGAEDTPQKFEVSALLCDLWYLLRFLLTVLFYFEYWITYFMFEQIGEMNSK